MSKLIDETLKGKELIAHLVANKSELIAKKRSIPRESDGIGGLPYLLKIKGDTVTKVDIGNIEPDATSIRVKLIANTAWYMDSQWDVLLPDCWAKSIADGKGRVHLHDHKYELSAEVGDVQDVYSMDIALTDFGINKAGTTQSLIYESDVKKSYDESTFLKYKNGRIKQHSIGLNYVKLELAVNDDEYKDEFAVWQKYIDRIINKEEAEQAGFFWAVSQIKLVEVSAVIAGSNPLTNTLSVKNDTQDQPPKSTVIEPSKFNVSEAIKSATFFNN